MATAPGNRPRIGVTCDLVEEPVEPGTARPEEVAPGRAHAPGPSHAAPGSAHKQVRRRAVQAMTYVDAIHAAGGLAILLPPVPELAQAQVQAVDGICLTGGRDVDTAALPGGGPTHPRATVMHPTRQRHEFALLAALDRRPELPALGVCLGMQLMGLHHGGRLNQHLPDTLPTADRHTGDFAHPIAPTPAWASGATGGLSARAGVTSNHHQALEQPGRLRVLALSDDGVIEAVDDPGRPFYLGVQWHPERTADEALGVEIFRRLVRAAAAPGQHA